jgi:TM2 domain-containing membrane protein YozV
MPTAPPSQAAPARAAAEPEPFQPVALLLAFLLPGLGHWYLGQTRRATLIASGVLGLFVAGVFIGGVSCVDRRDNLIWFLGQALNGPVAFATDYVHQHRFKVFAPSRGNTFDLRPANPDEARDPETGNAVRISGADTDHPTATTRSGRPIDPAYPPYVRSLSRMNEMGTLFTTIAGFLNVICMIDAAFNHRAERRRTPVETGVKRTLQSPTPAAGPRAGGGA